MHALGFPSAIAFNLTEDADGGILMPTVAGLYRFFHGRLERVFGLPVAEAVGVASGLLLVTGPADPSWVLLDGQPAPGHLGRPANVPYRVRAVQGKWQADPITGWNIGAALTRDASGTVLASCPGGWCEMSARRIADWNPSHPESPVFHPSESGLARVFRDRFGCVWLRSADAGAYQCSEDPRPIRLPASIAGRNVWGGMAENADGSMLLASVGSLAMGRPGSFQVVSTANGLPTEAITCAVRARDGTIWLGSIGGLYRFPFPFRLTYWKSRHGLVWSFARLRGALLAGTSAGVDRLNGKGEWETLPGSREFGSVSSLLPQGDGSVYAAVAEEGIIQLRPDGTLAARTPPGTGEMPTSLAQDSNGSVWMAGNGIHRVVRKGRDLALAPENLPDEPAANTLIVSAAGGSLVGCFEGNLIRRDAGMWRTVARNGLPGGLCRSVAFSPPGDLWAGYVGGFAWVHTSPSGAASIRVFSGGGDIGITPSYTFGRDARGWLWRGAGDGIHLADPSHAQAGIWLHLNETDGLPDLDVNRDSFFADRDGSVWWAAAASIIHFYPPPDLAAPAAPPPVFLSAYSIDGGAPVLAETWHKLPTRGKLAAHIGSLQFQGRNALRIRYRLLPEQKAWREQAGLDLDLATPSWGTHTLEIQSRFISGSWSPSWRSSLVVPRPWWFSWPALLAFAGMSFGATAGGIHLRRIRKARASAALPDLAPWRLAVLSPESQLVGSTLDRRFEVLHQVARGGFATVLQARDKRQAGRLCAIKVFRRELIDEDWLKHRFQQEVAALEQIRHPSVVSMYGHGIAPGGAPYLAMEFIEGGTLRDLLNSGAIPAARTASLLRQAAEALEQIHALGIYHRDLKPANLMLRAGAPAGEELVLIDFSIAIVKDPDQTIHGLSRAAGTIYYMAPEQAVGFATPASDIYSLAKVTLEMLTGRRLSALLPHASMDLPDRVRELAQGLPVPFSAESVDLLGAALEFDPARRPQTAARFAGPIVRDLMSASSGP